VATSSVNQLVDYVLHTPADPLRSNACVEQRYALIEKNLKLMKTNKKGSATKKTKPAKAMKK
jgi:4-O-beta-D-mannosyl-D-glucose phosphorylase